MKALIEQLAAAGYTASVAGGRLRLRYQRDGEPDAKAVAPLLSEVRARKAAVLAYLRRAERGAPPDPPATLQRCNALGAADALPERDAPDCSVALSVAVPNSVAGTERANSVVTLQSGATHVATLFGDPVPDGGGPVRATALQRCSVAPGVGARTLRTQRARCAHCGRDAAHWLPASWGAWGRWPLCEDHHAPIGAALAQGWRYAPEEARP